MNLKRISTVEVPHSLHRSHLRDPQSRPQNRAERHPWEPGLGAGPREGHETSSLVDLVAWVEHTRLFWCQLDLETHLSLRLVENNKNRHHGNQSI